MSDTEILRLDDVWKRHRIWKKRPESLKETLIRGLKGVRPVYEEFWALQGISLSVRRGEFVGICGHNGAGKSTLLRVIAGILPATHGRITVRGSLATLLELGSGFLADLTGRENIALNGAILGLGQEEIRRKMAAIVDFADIGEFIDSPVRTYSTGMYMRLGFSIASHVEAKILLLDEVLAVGDAEFQLKCSEWLSQLRASGTTVLMVSHDLPVLSRLCDRVAWMEHGKIVTCSSPDEVVERYGRAAEAPVAVEATP